MTSAIVSLGLIAAPVLIALAVRYGGRSRRTATGDDTGWSSTDSGSDCGGSDGGGGECD